VELLLLGAALGVSVAISLAVVLLTRLGPPPVEPDEDFDAWPPLSPGGVMDSALAPIPGFLGLQRLQAQAGMRASALLLLVLCMGSFVVLAGVGLALRVSPAATLLAAAAAGAAPLILVELARRGRSAALAAGLPTALRALSRLAGSGLATGAALQAASRELPGPLGQELRRAAAEAQAGRPLVEALRAVASRAPGCVDVRILVTAIALAEESSSDLGGLLSRIERTLGDRTARIRDVAARTLQVRVQAAVLVAMVPIAAGLLLLVQPDYLLDGWADPLGRALYQAAAMWAGLGVLCIAVLLRSRP
jgi:Flp pilus assembly protein TadB